MRTLSEIRETVERMHAMLHEMNKDSAIFWAEFKRDFPEVKLDEIAWRKVVYGDNSPTLMPDTVPDSATRN